MKPVVLRTTFGPSLQRLACALVGTLGLSGCAPGVTSAGEAQPPSSGAKDQSSTPNLSSAASVGQSDAAEGHGSAAVSVEHPLLDDRPPDPRGALPKLSFSQLGMHIGGESNTPESKEPFLRSIAKQEEAILKCYRWVNEPAKGGSFGVDLYIRKSGGAPEIRGIRQKIGGPEFVECMSEAFLAVTFQAPIRPTVLSYSMRFSLAPAPR